MVYQERLPVGNVIRLLMTAIIIFFVLLMFLIPANEREGLYFVAGVMVLMMLMNYAFNNMSVELKSDRLVAHFMPFRYTVHYHDIKGIEVIPVIPWYVGFGLRIWGRRIAFVSRRGPAVKIDKKTGLFRSLLLTTKDPEAFVQRLHDAARLGSHRKES